MRLKTKLKSAAFLKATLYLLSLTCIIYALYMAMLMPPLALYGNSGRRIDGRAFCLRQGIEAQNASDAAEYPDGHGGVDYEKMSKDFLADLFKDAVKNSKQASCLSNTAVDTPLLALRVALLIGSSAVLAFLASRSRMSH